MIPYLVFFDTIYLYTNLFSLLIVPKWMNSDCTALTPASVYPSQSPYAQIFFTTYQTICLNSTNLLYTGLILEYVNRDCAKQLFYSIWDVLPLWLQNIIGWIELIMYLKSRLIRCVYIPHQDTAGMSGICFSMPYAIWNLLSWSWQSHQQIHCILWFGIQDNFF